MAKKPNSYYRVSIKAVITKGNKVLLLQESDGRWELPGGGLEYNETPQQCLKREIKEELGVAVSSIKAQPDYIWSQEVEKKGEKLQRFFVAYKIELKSAKFKQTEEAITAGYFSKAEMKKLKLHPNIKKFIRLY